mgnify:CR=1 FL=1
MKKFAYRALASAGAMLLIPGMQGLGGLGGVAQAQPEDRMIEEIVVTARKREETLQDVPFAVQALSGDELSQRGANSLEDASNNIAGFTVQNLGPGQSQVAIRGISAGQIVRDQPGVKEQVGVYLDESVISLSLFTPDLDFYDMNRIEVLRGPQGTLYGSGSLSGTVKYVSNQPQMQVAEGAYQLGLSQISDGGFGSSSKGMINLPHGDTMALRLVGYNTEYGGWIDAAQPHENTRKDVNNGSRAGFRAAVKWVPSATIRLTPRIIYQTVNVNGFNREDVFNALANPFTTTRPTVSLGENEQYTQLQEGFSDEFLLADAVLEVDFAHFSLTSISSYTDREVEVLRDASALTLGVLSANRDAFGFDDETANDVIESLDGPLFDNTSVEVITQEIRLAGGNERFDWVGGLFYSDIRRSYGQNLPVTGFEQLTGVETEGQINETDSLFYSAIPYNFEQMALFGELTWWLTPKLSVSAGARFYDFEEERVLNFDGLFANQSIGVPGRTSSDGINPRVLVGYDLTETTQINGQIAQGFRLGGINDPLNTGACNQQDLETFSPFATRFDDEEVTNYEVGVKTGLMGGSATLNASVFHADIENLQVTLDAGTCSSRLVYPVDDARATGVEFEFEAYLGRQFNIAAAGSYVDTEIQQTLTSEGQVIGGVRKGNRFATTPEFQLSLAGTYEFAWNAVWDGYAVLSAQFIGDRFTQLADQEPGAGFTDPSASQIGNAPSMSLFVDPELPAYQIVNLRVGARSGQWELAGFVNNLTNERALQSYDRELGGVARLGYRVNQPLTVGTTLSYFFE